MPEDRSEVIEKLKRGALNSASEYVTVRREDLLIVLGTEPPRVPAHELEKDKKPA